MMKISHLSCMILVVVLSAWLTACAYPNVTMTENNAGSAETFAETSSSAGPGETVTNAPPAEGETVSSGGDTITSDQPGQESGSAGMPPFVRPAPEDAAQAAEGDQPAGETAGDSGPADGQGTANSAQADSMTNLDTTTWQVYTDATFGFRVLYPPTFAAKPAGQGDVLFGATAIATVNFVDTQNELAEIAPPPFAVRVYTNEPEQSLDSWLASNGVTGGEANVEAEPFRTDKLDGIRVNSLDFMAPGWSVFVLRGERVYQLVPLGEEGEAMLGTFELL